MSMEGWPEDIALHTFSGMYADALREHCPMGQFCKLGGVAIEASELSELKLVAECPVERCPVDLVFGVAGAQALLSAQEVGLISGGSLNDKS